jgi:hypothetical protein
MFRWTSILMWVAFVNVFLLTFFNMLCHIAISWMLLLFGCDQYNFVGRLLGPRGNSLKRVEASTQCRVYIRGRGSVKDSVKVAKWLFHTLSYISDSNDIYINWNHLALFEYTMYCCSTLCEILGVHYICTLLTSKYLVNFTFGWTKLYIAWFLLICGYILS